MHLERSFFSAKIEAMTLMFENMALLNMYVLSNDEENSSK